MLGLILVVALGMAAVMTLAWAIALRSGNCGWVDVVWSFGTGAVGVAFALAPPGTPGARAVLVAVLVAAWSVRLGWHLAQRTAGGTEDVRYAALRVEWGANFPWRLWLFLQIQALAAVMLGISILLAARNPAPGLRLLDILAVAVLAAAVLGEGIADAQLARFKADPANKGRVCDAGLWRFSRHPNYFFEWMGWVAYPLFAIDPAFPWGWLALSAPAVMYWLLVHVSGIPPLEMQMLKSRGDAFRAYQASTNAFFPGPPRARPVQTSPAP